MTSGSRMITRLLMTSAMIGWTTGSAFAQSSPGNIADPDVILDDNGVDLLSGKFYAVATQAASQSVSYQAKWFGANDASLLNSRVVVSGSNVFVSVAGTTTKFTIVGSAYVPDDDNGETLVRAPANNGFIFRNKAGDAAYFDDDPANLDGNAPGTTSARLNTLTFADQTRPSLNFMYKTVSSGGLAYHRISMVMETYWGGGEGYNALKPSYVSNVATNSDFTKLASVKAFYQGPYATQQPCSHLDDSCPTTVAREQLTISSTTTAGIETISMTDKGGEVTVIVKDANGVTGIRNPGDATNGISLTYNGSGEVSTLTHYGLSFTYAFGISGANRTVTVTLAGGGSKYYVVDPVRRILLSKRNEEMETLSFGYDGEDRVTQVTYPEGNYVTFAYDARSNVTQSSRVAKAGSGDATTTTAQGFLANCTNVTPTCNQAIWSKDAKGTQTDYLNGLIEGPYYVDEIRFPAATVGGDRLVVRNQYSQIFGRIQDGSGFEEPTGVVATELTDFVTLKAALGNFSNLSQLSEKTINFDDNFGEHEILPLSTLDKGLNGSGGWLYRDSPGSDYDSLGRLSTTDHWQYSNAAYQYFYDANNRLTGLIAPDHDGTGSMLFLARRLVYNSSGLVEKTEDGTATAQTQAALNAMIVLRATENVYDVNRRLVQSQTRAGGVVISVAQFSYNAQGLIECATQRMNPAIFASLPASACTLGAQGNFGPDRITKHHYDAAGRRLRIEQAFATVDVMDEVTFSYNANGTVATTTDAKGNRTSFEYDGHDRLKKTIFPHKTSVGASDPTDYEQYWYDVNDNLIQKRLRDGQLINFTYDLLNRMTLIDLPEAESDISYTYDVEGQLKTTTRGTVTNAISYDPFGRVISEGNNVGNVQFQYDDLNRMTRTTWPDGFYVTYDYHSAGPIKAIKENGAVEIVTYAYDSFGRRMGVSYGNGASQNYGYDTTARLSSIGHDLIGSASDQTINLTYNPASQITARTLSNDAYAYPGHFNVDRPYQANGLNQYTASGTISIGYDPRGNLTSSGTDAYSYTSDNLLQTGPGGAVLTYDGRGGLFETAKAGVTTRFLYAGSELVGEYSGLNAMLRRYIHGPGVDDPLLWYEGTGTTNKRYLMADERGSITTLSDSSGAIFAMNSYDDYGIPGSTNVGRFQYTGQAWLPEVGMSYYKARIYSPTLGRFMQTDPIGFGGGANLYAYVGNDPVNKTDPTGLVEETIGNPIVVEANRPSNNCFAIGGSCYSTGRDLGDELNLDLGLQLARISEPPQSGLCPAAPAVRQSDSLKGAGANKSFSEAEAIARRIANEELARTRRITDNYRLGGHNDIYDAERHARWVYRMSVEIGTVWSAHFGNGHEIEGLIDGQPFIELWMDLNNNSVGINAAISGLGIPTRATPGLIFIRDGRFVRQGC